MGTEEQISKPAELSRISMKMQRIIHSLSEINLIEKTEARSKFDMKQLVSFEYVSLHNDTASL